MQRLKKLCPDEPAELFSQSQHSKAQGKVGQNATDSFLHCSNKGNRFSILEYLDVYEMHLQSILSLYCRIKLTFLQMDRITTTRLLKRTERHAVYCPSTLEIFKYDNLESL